MTSPIKTRVLVISDTHGLQFTRQPHLGAVDVVIHCGDLTEHSLLSEFHETTQLLRQIDAPLKLVIPGNHDFTLDDAAFAKIAEASRMPEDLLVKAYGAKGAARKLWEEAARDGKIVLLDEGEHTLTLANGATLKVYASPYTPSTERWGFKYSRNDHHEFGIGPGVDIAITHGPPRGIMDMTYDKKQIGCPTLFRAVAKAQPRIHCFGHIHDSWGAKLIAWRSEIPDDASHLNSIDNGDSLVIETLETLQDSGEEAAATKNRVAEYEQQGYCDLDHCETKPVLGAGKTLFINAAMKGRHELDQFPWLVEIDLPVVKDA